MNTHTQLQALALSEETQTSVIAYAGSLMLAILMCSLDLFYSVLVLVLMV